MSIRYSSWGDRDHELFHSFNSSFGNPEAMERKNDPANVWFFRHHNSPRSIDEVIIVDELLGYVLRRLVEEANDEH